MHARAPIRPLALVTLLAAGACGGASPPIASDEVVVAAPRVAGPPTPSVLPPSSRPEPEEGGWAHHVTFPTAPACVYPRSAYSGPARTAADEEPFGHVGLAAASDVHLPQGAPPAQATIEAHVGSLTLRGVVRADDLDLYPSRPLRLGGILHLQPYAELRVLRASPGRLAVTVLDDLEDLTHRTEPFTVDVACDGLRFDTAEFDPWARLGKPLGTVTLRGPSVPLAARAGAPPVARATIDAGHEPTVAVLGRASGQTQIAWERSDVLLVAWVPDVSIGPPPYAGPGGGGSGMGLLGVGTGGGTTQRRACRGALAVGILQDDVAVRMGTLAPESTVVAGATVRDLTVIWVRHPALSLADDVRLVVKTVDLGGCPAVTE